VVAGITQQFHDAGQSVLVIIEDENSKRQFHGGRERPVLLIRIWPRWQERCRAFGGGFCSNSGISVRSACADL
jgi:hypothetical protein